MGGWKEPRQNASWRKQGGSERLPAERRWEEGSREGEEAPPASNLGHGEADQGGRR